MFDRYSKAVLTIIAGALVVIAWSQVGPSPASAEFSQGCGSATNPCWIQNAPSIPIFTIVQGPIDVTGSVRVIDPIRIENR